jgi:hypothetical protein
LSWGRVIIDPFRVTESKNITVYIRNKGTKPITLFLNISDLDPPFFSQYISINWDYDGHVLGSGEVMKAIMILYIDSSIWFESVWIQNYRFNIIISASGL